MKKYFLIIVMFPIFQLNAEVKLEDCASIESDIKRLACYDYLTTGISKTSKEIEKKDEQVSNNSVPNIISEKDANFGLSNKQKKEADIKVIKSQLVSMIYETSKTFGGKTRFKLANNQLWESQSVLSTIKLNNFRVKNNIVIKKKFSFKNTAQDVLITSQLRVALVLNKNVKAANFNIDTINQKTYVFGIAQSQDEKKEIIQEAKQIVDLKELVTSILMTSDLRAAI